MNDDSTAGGTVLRDATLKAKFAALLPHETFPADPDGPKSPIQPSSVDLTVGSIYLPDVAADELGGINRPRTEHVLQPGHTAVVLSKEDLELPSTIAAIGFPPTRVSDNGILMTNPGHVDPGYHGKLSFTVINMGREPFELRPGDRIVTLVFFELDGTPDADYRQRNPMAPPEIRPERLSRLAPDMLDVDQRIDSKVQSEESRTRRISIWVPVVVGAFVTIGTLISTVVGPLMSNWLSNDVKDRVEQLEKGADLSDIKTQIAELQRRLPTTTTTAAP